MDAAPWRPSPLLLLLLLLLLLFLLLLQLLLLLLLLLVSKFRTPFRLNIQFKINFLALFFDVTYHERQEFRKKVIEQKIFHFLRKFCLQYFPFKKKLSGTL